MKSQTVGLVLAGKASNCPLTRLRNMPEWLGPVKAHTFRQASRFTNKQRAGYVAHEYSDLSSARTILICAEEENAGEIIGALAGVRMSWRRKSVVLCGGSRDQAALEGFRERGASTGVLTLLDATPQLWCLAEGDSVAVRTMKRLIESGGGRITEVSKGSLELCEAAVSFATWLLLPAVDASMVSLRKAGLSPRRAAPVVERLVERSLRGYLRSGRRSWKVPQTAEKRRAFTGQIETLFEADPELGELLAEMARISLRRVGGNDDWVAVPEAKVKGAASGT